MLPYQTWRCYNKFEPMIALVPCYWYVKIPRCGCMEQQNELRFMFKNVKQLWRSVLVSRWFATGHWGRPHLWDSLISAGASPYFHIIKLIQSKPFIQKSIHAILYKCNLYTKNRVMGRAPHRLIGKREGAISGNHLYRHEHDLFSLCMSICQYR